MTADKAVQAYYQTFMDSLKPSGYSGNGYQAFPVTSVPDDRTFPYMTYSFVENGGIDNGDVNSTAELWDRSTSESASNERARNLWDYIEKNDQIAIDGGIILVKQGSPFSQAIRDEADPTIKRRYINITFEYISVR